MTSETNTQDPVLQQVVNTLYGSRRGQPRIPVDSGFGAMLPLASVPNGALAGPLLNGLTAGTNIGVGAAPGGVGGQTVNVVNAPTFSGLITGQAGLTISAGGVTVTGNSTITGTLGGLTGLTVASGGATITGATSIAGALSTTGAGGTATFSQGLTVQAGGAAITGTTSVAGAFSTTGASGTATFSQGLTVSAGGIAITGNSTITGTLGGLTGLTVASGGLTISAGGAAITGNVTLVGSLTLSGANNLLVAVGQGLDTSAAGALGIGPTNATSIVLGKGGVASRVMGLLTVGSDMDRDTAGVLFIGAAGTATGVQIGSASFAPSFPGGLTVGAGKTVDTTAAGALSIGPTNATSLILAKGGVNTRVLGLLTVGSDLDRDTAGTLAIGQAGTATSIAIARAGVTTAIGGPLTVPAGGSFDAAAAGALLLGTVTATSVQVGPNGLKVDAAGHLISLSSGTPATSNLGVNVTSATFTGNDVRGTIAIVMAGALAANTRVCTATFATSYGATPPKITLVDQTSTAGLAIVNSYVLSQSTGVSFDLAFDQALAAGTYTIDYIVIG